jgi:O-antigen biosynthesis protein
MMQRADGRPVANLSVAISTRERADALGRCLDALLSGEVLPAEIVVVDQSEDDRSWSVVEQRRPSAVPIVYVHQAGSGLAASQNAAIAHATRPVVAVTDDDCLPAPNWIAVIQRAFAPPDRIDALTGRVLPLGHARPGLYAVSSRTSEVRAEFERNAMPWEIGSGNNFAVKRDWLNRIGGNDARLGPGSPGQGGLDMDLFYRLLRTGARIRYEPQSLVYHEQTTKAGRMARRGPYGYGIGAGCIIRLREGDRQALRILTRWALMRLWRLAGALGRREWMLVCEEVLVLGGTVRGIGYGIRARTIEQTAGAAS